MSTLRATLHGKRRATGLTGTASVNHQDNSIEVSAIVLLPSYKQRNSDEVSPRITCLVGEGDRTATRAASVPIVLPPLCRPLAALSQAPLGLNPAACLVPRHPPIPLSPPPLGHGQGLTLMYFPRGQGPPRPSLQVQ